MGSCAGGVASPEFQIPLTGTSEDTSTVWREVETQDPGYDRLRIIGSSTQTLSSAASIGDTVGFETEVHSIPTRFNDEIVRLQFDFETSDGLYNRRRVSTSVASKSPPAHRSSPRLS